MPKAKARSRPTHFIRTWDLVKLEGADAGSYADVEVRGSYLTPGP